MEHLSRPALTLLVLNAFNTSPTTDHTRPPNDRVENDGMWMDNHVLQDYRVLDPGSIADFDLGTDGYIRADPCSRVDLSGRVNADQTFDLV